MNGTMTRRTVATGLVALMAATAISQLQAPPVAQAHAPRALVQNVPPQQWSLKFDGPADTNVPFALYNQREKDHLHHGPRRWGIALKWSAAPKTEWKFVKCDAVTESSPIHHDEALALYNTKTKEYVEYKKRKYGINLGWSKKPNCQWKVRGDSAGAKIGGSSQVSNAMLYNTVVKDYMVNNWRPVGVNLRWYTYPFEAQVLDYATQGVCFVGKLSKAAQGTCEALKALREFEKRMGYPSSTYTPLSKV
ncbi:hypothetical protein [Streptomyces sp. NPDC000410]|uniref:hypothetical protein n=1 Tax=Streptomyces sp. NPDC000410 TaxID=3154254 RepID=UPI00331ED46C